MAPSITACSTVNPRARSWLMYSTMITPISTDTPISARKPSPDETLKCVPVSSRLIKPPRGEQTHHRQDQPHPLPRLEGRIQNERHQQDRDGNDHRQPLVGTLLALVLAGPVQVVTFRQLHFLMYFLDCLADSAAQVSPPHCT